MRIDGRNINMHPLIDETVINEYVKFATVLAAQVSVDGKVFTPEGEMEFNNGDYIVTDNPPTHAWPVKKGVFENTYSKIVDGVISG